MEALPANSPTTTESLSIVIITRNAHLLLRRCLQSIYENVVFPFEIILVDNASCDETIAMIKHAFPKVKLIRNSRNRGVAPARNQGLRACRGSYILIIDDDAYVVGDAINRMIAFLKKHPTVGLCGSKLIDSQGNRLPSCKRFPSLLSLIFNRFTKEPNERSSIVLQHHLMLDWDHKHASPVDYVIGACQLITRETIENVGFYDEKIFYGPEDIDICYRIWRKGQEIWYVPEATVVHVTRRITKQNPLTLVSIRHFLAILRLFIKYRYGDFKRISKNNDIKRIT